MKKKFLVKYNSKNYFCSCFDEIMEVIIGEIDENLLLTNRILFVEMIRLCAILEGIEVEIIDSNLKKYEFNKKKYYLNIDDDDSIIELINLLDIAKILYLI